MIELKNVTKTFYTKDTAVDALSGVSLRVAEGEIFGVIGASGAGKSTLIRCINLLERPTKGEIIVDGRRLQELRSRELTQVRRNIGMIFQHFNLLSSRTVFGNVALPLELSHMPAREIANRVNELLALVGLQGRESEYPSRLSGGQKQRVAIARTLASNPKVLLCDEATSALDPETTQSILTLLKDINRRFKITILLITHEMNVVKTICDKVAVISEGKLIEQGTVSEIFSHPREELTRRFIASSLHFAIPPEYEERLRRNADGDAADGLGGVPRRLPGDAVVSLVDVGHPLVKLGFTGESANLPLLSAVSRLFDLDSHIVTAQLEQAGGVQFGFMLVEFAGSVENAQKAIDYYIAHRVKVEIIGYV